MALIKCEECGKKFSDKANACPDCACPVGVKKEKNINIKDVEEKEILSIILDKKKLRIFCVLYMILGVIFSVVSLFILKVAFDESALLIPVFVFGTFAVIFLVEGYLYKKNENNQLVLTNKRLEGSITIFFTTTNINIPLERVDNLVVSKDFISTGIKIMSNNITKCVGFVLNAQEFVDATIKEIEKYKKI